MVFRNLLLLVRQYTAESITLTDCSTFIQSALLGEKKHNVTVAVFIPIDPKQEVNTRTFLLACISAATHVAPAHLQATLINQVQHF